MINLNNGKEASLTMQDSTPRGNEEDNSSGNIKGLKSELSLLVEVLKAIKARINDKRP